MKDYGLCEPVQEDLSLEVKDFGQKATHFTAFIEKANFKSKTTIVSDNWQILKSCIQKI